VLQLLFISLASFTALSRVSDYKHHWSDVLAGSLLGAVIGFVMAHHCAQVFLKKPSEKEQKEEEILRTPSMNFLVPPEEKKSVEPSVVI
jgi:phosphatidate phosphatase